MPPAPLSLRELAACLLAFLAACSTVDHSLDEAARRATLQCQALAACQAALDAGVTAPSSCEAQTLHVVQLCSNGCITTRWSIHDGALDGGTPIPAPCRCTSDEDCAPEVRRCDATSGACVTN